LLSSQINFTLTNFANHTEKFSRDAINRYLIGEKITPHLVWGNEKGQVEQIAGGNLLFDDIVVDKNFSFKMDLVRRQWSGDAHGVIKVVGVVICVYVKPTLDRFWIIDYRIYDPEGDGKTKLDHVHDMLANCVYQKLLLFRFVLMDSWYATKGIMLSQLARCNKTRKQLICATIWKVIVLYSLSILGENVVKDTFVVGFVFFSPITLDYSLVNQLRNGKVASV
jgi:hypothetical protein